MPFRVEPTDLLIIALIALIIFGPQMLPEVGRGLGRAISEFRKGAKEMTEGLREEVAKPVDPGSGPAASVPPVAPPSNQFCTKCGAPNRADARFCSQCGSAFYG